MASKKKPAKLRAKPTSKSTKVSSTPKSSPQRTKVSKGSVKKTATKLSKAKSLKKPATQSMAKSIPKPITKNAALSSKKPKAAPPSKKKTPRSSSTSRKNPTRSAATKGSKSSELVTFSSQDRYNIGGLCACVIDTSTNAGESKLRRILTHLQLSEMDRANLTRLSQGIRIPKLFSDGIKQKDARERILHSLENFTKEEDSSGKQWTRELEELRRLLAS